MSSKPFLLLLLCFVLAVGLFACSGPTVSTTNGQDPGISRIVSVHRPHRVIQSCADRRRLYPSLDIVKYDSLLARWFDEDTTVNQGGITFYQSYLAHDTYDASLESPLVIHVPSFPDDPFPPTPVPTPTTDPNNPYKSGVAQAQVNSENQQASASYQKSLADSHAKLATIRAQVKSQTDMLRNLRPTPDASSSGQAIIDCLALASERFQQEQDGEHWLIIGTTLQAQMPSVLPRFSITGVWIRMQYTVCMDSVVACANDKQAWTTLFLSTGAVRVDWFDVGQSDSLTYAPF